MAATVERLAAIPELAAEAGISPKTMRRRLLRLHEQRGGKWLLRLGVREYAVNRSLLKAEHPEIFSRSAPTRADVERLGQRLRDLEKRQNAIAAKVRQL